MIIILFNGSMYVGDTYAVLINCLIPETSQARHIYTQKSAKLTCAVFDVQRKP